MPWWLTLIIFTAVTVVGELLRPKPRFEDARPAGLGDFSFPTATEGRAVPIVWGTVRLKAPNVVWYGNLTQRAITEEVKTGMFSSTEVTKGYRYYVGIHFALCRGPIDKITEVRINDKFASSGRTGEGIMAINQPNILGGEEFGAGGVITDARSYLYVGDSSQVADSYLESAIGTPMPGFRGTAHFVFHGYHGTSPNIPPWSFDVQRIPDGLNMAVEDPGAEAIDSTEANPLNVIYEILTDTDWGLGIPTSDIDITNFRTAASTAASEGNGFSMTLDSEKEASDIINEVLRQLDASLYFDREAGLWKITLIRDDYTAGSLPLYDESNVIELSDYSRTAWTETSNQVRLLFADTDDDFKQTYAIAQDMGNVEIQGGNIYAEVKYPGCKTRSLANKLVWRELKTLGYPLAKHTITMNREGFDLRPGSVYRWSWDSLGISELVMRVSRIDFGTLDDGKVRVHAVQDIFAAVGSGTFSDPSPTGWDDAQDDPVAVDAADVLAFEAPRQLVVKDPKLPDQNPRVWAGARFPGGGTVAVAGYTRSGSSRPLAGDFSEDFVSTLFLQAGELASDLSAYEASESRPWTASIDVTGTPDGLDDIRHLASGDAEGPERVSSLSNIAYIDGEFIGFEGASWASGSPGTLTLTGVYRGLFHTAPKDHASGTRVWFVSDGGNLTQRSLGSTKDEVDVKLRSQTQFSIISEAATPTEEVSLNSDRIWSVPLAPRDPYLNGTYADDTNVSVDDDYTTETGESGDDGRGLEVEVTPRAWRIDNVLEDHNLAQSFPAWEDDSPNFDFELVLDPSGTPATTAVVNVAGSGTSLGKAYLLRNAMIVALGDNTPFPSDARLEVTAKHTPAEVGSEVTNPVKMTHDMTIVSSLQSADDLTFGGFGVSTASPAVVFGETGSYTFDIHSSLPTSGILEARINSGSWTLVIASGLSSGTLAVSAGDSVELRFDQAPAADQFFDITGPTSEQGYGVLLA